MPDSNRKIGIDDMGIANVLKKSRLSVPPNQREYSWEEKHVLDLFQDLQKAIDGGAPSYFLGTIALTGNNQDRPEVTDGQQRLATTTLLLAAMRDYAHSLGQTFYVNWIEREYLTFPDPDESRDVSRLTLNVDDREFFTHQVVHRPGEPQRLVRARKASHERIADAVKLAQERVRIITGGYTKDADKLARLKHWVRYLAEDVLVIVLKLPSDLNAFRMFETLNDRGLRTSQVDIVKNYLFREASRDGVAQIQPKWSALMMALESLDVDEVELIFLRHFIMTKHGMTRAAEIYEKIEKTVAGSFQAISFVGEMEECASDYVAILSPDHKKWNDYPHGVKSSIRTMKTLKVQQIRPLMLAVARRFSSKEAEQAFRLFVSLTVRFLIAGGGRGGTLEEAYATAAQKVASGEINTTKDLKTHLGSVVPTDTEFENAFAVARVSKNYLARYYLRALELKTEGSSEPEWVPNDGLEINLEHILPDNPQKNWPEIDEETAAALHTRIGNMVLLQATPNSIIGNSPFDEKKEVLRKSAFVLTAQVARFKSWGKKEIDARQKKLAELAVKTWPLVVK
jgi:hypothetical protein